MKQDTKLYYTAPPDKAFKDMKKVSTELWSTYDNTYGYVDEKVNRIKDIENVADNFMYMLAMFDSINQEKILNMVSKQTKEEVVKRLPDDYRVSLGMTFEDFLLNKLK